MKQNILINASKMANVIAAASGQTVRIKFSHKVVDGSTYPVVVFQIYQKCPPLASVWFDVCDIAPSLLLKMPCVGHYLVVTTVGHKTNNK